MKLSETLFSCVMPLWDEAAGKPFIREMAVGTLARDRFRNYMTQDYLYLKDYIRILERALGLADDPELREFLRNTIAETERETYRVHVPNMRKLGISEETVRECRKEQVLDEYVGYMLEQLDRHGLYAVLTALLQCSWVYAYIGQKLAAEYPDEIAASPYKSWFDAYTCQEYLDANRVWIEILDRRAGICENGEDGISENTIPLLCDIFRTCAAFENRFWDTL